MNPFRQLRMETVIDPLALAAVFEEPAGTQLGQVAGYLGLAVVERPDEFAHAQLTLGRQHEHYSRSGFVAQAFKDGYE